MQAVLEEHEPGQFVVKLQGELDMATEPVLSDMIREVLSREQVGKLKIDLAGLQFLDSTGVRALLQIRRAAENRGVNLEITHPREHVAEVLRVAAVDRLLGVATGGEPR
jgi:anti-sigma B factor antagonist